MMPADSDIYRLKEVAGRGASSQKHAEKIQTTHVSKHWGNTEALDHTGPI